MLANHDTLDPEDLFTITARVASRATADAFARDPDSQGLWFLSMVGSQTALKAIWAIPAQAASRHGAHHKGGGRNGAEQRATSAAPYPTPPSAPGRRR